MERYELYQLIGLQPEIVRKLERAGACISLEQIDGYLVRLMDRGMAALAYGQLKELLKEDEGSLKMLYCQLECARRVFDRYMEKQIPLAVYVRTMACFTRFLDECGRKHGRMFFDRGWWAYRQLSMSLFRIGELEYEFKQDGGEDVLAIHIPSDADLSREAVGRSLADARQFFRLYYGGYRYRKYTCHSWLLSPALTPLLPENSHILSFQQRFRICGQDLGDKNDKEYIEWLFQVPIGTDYQNLPESTSLQKSVKKLLLSGGTVGSAYGIMDVLA